jgi:hypothetical protein
MNIGATGRGRDLAKISSAAAGLAACVVTKTVEMNDAPPTWADLTEAIFNLKHFALAAGMDWAACELRAHELFLQEGGR